MELIGRKFDPVLNFPMNCEPQDDSPAVTAG